MTNEEISKIVAKGLAKAMRNAGWGAKRRANVVTVELVEGDRNES